MKETNYFHNYKNINNMNFQELAKEMELFSPKELLENLYNGITDAINYYENSKKHISKPTKPRLKNDASAKEMIDFIPTLQEYELLEKQYKIDYQKAKTYNYNLYLLIRETILLESFFYDYVPIEYQERLIEYVFSRSGSYIEKYELLYELVEIFNVK